MVRLWKAGLELFRKRPEIFDPHHASKLHIAQLRDHLKDSGVSQRHGPDTRAWRTIATSVVSGVETAIPRVINTGHGSLASRSSPLPLTPKYDA